MTDLGASAAEPTRSSLLERGRTGILVASLWIVSAVVLSELTVRVRDWFDMTDEMRYERLAISIAQTHSLVPRVHGVDIQSFSQLYPLLIAPLFRHGLAPENVHAAHVLNAWIMTSACIPAFLLARRVTGRRWAAFLAATLAVAMPWILYSAMLMTEVASYPASLWALLALQRATVAPSRRNDVIALAGLAIAYFARAELLVLVIVLPLAVLAYEVRGGERSARGLLRKHEVLAGAYLLLAAAAVYAAAVGRLSRVVGIYGVYAAHEGLLQHGLAGGFVEHVATFSLGFGVLPFVAGVAWLLANAVRPPRSREQRAFAWIGSIAVVGIMLQATHFDVTYTGYVHDRFLLYLVPVVVIGVLCAALDEAPLRRSLLLPAALVALGFAVGSIPRSTWAQFDAVLPDTPIAVLYRPLVDAFGSLSATRVALALATPAGSLLLAVMLRRSRRRSAAVLVAMLAVALPSTGAYVFVRFFGTDDWAERPLTNPQVEQFTWVDKAVGTKAAVTIAPYPVSSAWFVNLRVWRDYEFWNKSIARNVEAPQVFEYTGIWFPKTLWRFDPRTGRASVSPTRYVLEADQESRFRVSGTAIANTDGLQLIDAARPWRTDWLSFGLYDDGWTRPGVTARIRVFAAPDQHGSAVRTVTFGIRAPEGVATRPFRLSSNLQRVTADAGAGDTTLQGVTVCVPQRGYAEVRLSTPDASAIPGDLRSLETSLTSRRGGAFVSEIALSDEVGGPC
jgi:hypothetical protein